MRTCVGCGRRASQTELVRLARAPEAGILVSRTAPGRGAWLCAGSLPCLERAVKRGALRRALGAEVASSTVATLPACVANAVTACVANAIRDSFVSPGQNMEESSAAGLSPGIGPTTTRRQKG